MRRHYPSVYVKKKHKKKESIFSLPFVKPSRKGKEMFYLTTHSTHFILRLYGVRHMVKDHSDSEKGNALPPGRIAHTTAFVTPVMEHWLDREIAQWIHPIKDRSDDPSHHERTLLPWRYISLQIETNNVNKECYIMTRQDNI